MSEEFPGDPSELVLKRIAEGEKKRLRELKENLHAAAEAHAEKEIKSFNRIAELEAELAKMKTELNLRRNQMSQFPFCPDHRDKVHGKECRECEVEHLRACLKRYGEHFRSCPAYSNMPKEPCTCGLAAELKEGE